MDTKRERRKLSLTVEEKRQRRNRLNRVMRLRAKEEAVAYMGGRCKICNGVFPVAAFDFHHRNPEEKDIDPGALVRRSKEVLYSELAKCDLLCANCHRILHWEMSNHDTDWDESVMPVLELTYNGETRSLREWADIFDLSYETLRARVRDCGWETGKALTTPVTKAGTNKPNVITALGKTQPLAEWVRETGIPANTIRSRLRMGWTTDKTMTAPRRMLRRYKAPDNGP